MPRKKYTPEQIIGLLREAGLHIVRQMRWKLPAVDGFLHFFMVQSVELEQVMRGW